MSTGHHCLLAPFHTCQERRPASRSIPLWFPPAVLLPRVRRTLMSCLSPTVSTPKEGRRDPDDPSLIARFTHLKIVG